MEPTNESVNVRGEESAEADQRIQFAGARAQLALGIGKDAGDFVTEYRAVLKDEKYALRVTWDCIKHGGGHTAGSGIAC